MIRARYSSEVFIQNGRIRRSVPIGLENASNEQTQAILLIKPVMHAWLRSRIEGNADLQNSQIFVKAKYVESAQGLTIEFRVQTVQPIG